MVAPVATGVKPGVVGRTAVEGLIITMEGPVIGRRPLRRGRGLQVGLELGVNRDLRVGRDLKVGRDLVRVLEAVSFILIISCFMNIQLLMYFDYFDICHICFSTGT